MAVRSLPNMDERIVSDSHIYLGGDSFWRNDHDDLIIEWFGVSELGIDHVEVEEKVDMLRVIAAMQYLGFNSGKVINVSDYKLLMDYCVYHFSKGIKAVTAYAIIKNTESLWSAVDLPLRFPHDYPAQYIRGFVEEFYNHFENTSWERMLGIATVISASGVQPEFDDLGIYGFIVEMWDKFGEESMQHLAHLLPTDLDADSMHLALKHNIDAETAVAANG